MNFYLLLFIILNLIKLNSGYQQIIKLNNKEYFKKEIYKEIYFIKHGETELNNLQEYESNNYLNKNGIIQSIKTGEYLKKYRINSKCFDCIISSPLERTKQSAEIIASVINYDKSNIIYVDLLEKNDDIKIPLIIENIDPIEKYRNNLQNEKKIILERCVF
jgi:hypothetical protein